MKTAHLLKEAMAHHQTGRFEAAEAVYHRILSVEPGHPDALHLMGLIKRSQGRSGEAVAFIEQAIGSRPDIFFYYNSLGAAYQDQNKFEEALACYQKAIDINPEGAEAYCNKGAAFQARGRTADAVFYYREALAHDPNYADAAFNLGVVLHETGDLKGAVRWYEKAAALQPLHSKVYGNLGAAWQTLGHIEKAVTCYEKAISADPSNPDTYNNLAVLFQSQGMPRDAIFCCRKALDLRPAHAGTYYNLGNALKESGNFPEAITAYEMAIALQPGYPDAHNNMGTAYLFQQLIPEAVSCFKAALAINPDYSKAHNNLGTAYRDLGDAEAAIRHYRQAISAAPDFAEAHNNLGGIHLEKGLFAEAGESFRQALRIRPDFINARYNLGNVLEALGDQGGAVKSYETVLYLNPDHSDALAHLYHLYQHACRWDRLDALSARLDRMTDDALARGVRTAEMPHLNISRHADSARNQAVAASWSRFAIEHSAQNPRRYEFSERKHRSGKIVLGYLSNTVHNHPGAHLVAGLFKRHDRGRFGVRCYSYGKDDGSIYRKMAMSDCDYFHDMVGEPYDVIAQRIFDDRVDILIDLRGHTKGNDLRVCCRRPSPVQVVYLGFPGTSGADFFDYIITDRIVTPEGDIPFYTEAPVFMPHCYQINDCDQTISAVAYTRSEFGLPETGTVLASFNTPYKIEPVMFDCWMRILNEIERAVLWLFVPRAETQAVLRREAENRGVSPNRLVFAGRLPKPEHLARLKLADLMLDTRICTGHTTTSDALYAGVPLIVVAGTHFASRVSESILSAIGMSDMVTPDLNAYERKAVFLAGNPAELAKIRDTLAINRLSMPLFDTSRFVRHLEEAYQLMWAAYRAGHKPAPILVKES